MAKKQDFKKNCFIYWQGDTPMFLGRVNQNSHDLVKVLNGDFTMKVRQLYGETPDGFQFSFTHRTPAAEFVEDYHDTAEDILSDASDRGWEWVRPKPNAKCRV